MTSWRDLGRSENWVSVGLRDVARHKVELHAAETLRLLGRGRLRSAWLEASTTLAYGRLLFRAERALHDEEAQAGEVER